MNIYFTNTILNDGMSDNKNKSIFKNKDLE